MASVYDLTVAYAESEVQLPHASATNYNVILSADAKHTAALNNLGVECDHLGLSIRSVDFYNRASEQGNTLASANLAYRLINQGFEAEARKLLKDAQSQKDAHPNVAQALADLAARRSAEDSRWENIIRSGTRQKQFFHSFAEAYFTQHPRLQDLSGTWMLGSASVELQQEGSSVRAEWSEGSARRRLEGTFLNRGSRVRLRKWTTSLFDYTKGHFDDGDPGFAYITGDGREIYVMTLAKNEPEFLKLVRQLRNDPDAPIVDRAI